MQTGLIWPEPGKACHLVVTLDSGTSFDLNQIEQKSEGGQVLLTPRTERLNEQRDLEVFDPPVKISRVLRDAFSGYLMLDLEGKQLLEYGYSEEGGVGFSFVPRSEYQDEELEDVVLPG